MGTVHVSAAEAGCFAVGFYPAGDYDGSGQCDCTAGIQQRDAGRNCSPVWEDWKQYQSDCTLAERRESNGGAAFKRMPTWTCGFEPDQAGN